MSVYLDFSPSMWYTDASSYSGQLDQLLVRYGR